MKNTIFFLILFIGSNIFATKTEAVSEIGSLTSIATIVRNNNNQPIEYKLEQNHPNPFNPSTIINYSLAKSGNVQIKIFDISGKEIATLLNEPQAAGCYSLYFNTNDIGIKLSSGLYFYTFRSGNFSATRKMILLK